MSLHLATRWVQGPITISKAAKTEWNQAIEDYVCQPRDLKPEDVLVAGPETAIPWWWRVGRK